MYISKDSFFYAEPLNDHCLRIHGIIEEKCYLVMGNRYALLIDGLSGVGKLRPFVESIIGLPIVLALTHGHMDHTGAAYEFNKCFIHPDDIALMYSPAHTDPKRRLDFVCGSYITDVERRITPTLDDVIIAHPVETFPVYDGDVFDLGGRQIEVISVPGHSKGSVVYLDRQDRVIYFGDACNSNTLLGLAGSCSVKEYLDGLEHLNSFSDQFDFCYGGHAPQKVSKIIVRDGITLCKRILAGNDDAVPIKNGDGRDAFLALRRNTFNMPENGTECNIVYRKDELTEKEKQPVMGWPEC